MALRGALGDRDFRVEGSAFGGDHGDGDMTLVMYPAVIRALAQGT